MYFATCFGGWFHRFYRDKGAALVEGYDWAVAGDVADANMAATITSLVENGSSVYQAFLQDSVMKRTYFNDHYVNLKIYPDPMDDSTASRFYFPAWFDKITIKGIPDEANSVSVNLISGAGKGLASKSYPVSSNTIVIEDLDDVFFIPGGTPTIQVKALDSSGKEYANKQVTGVVSAGANSAEITLSGNEDRKHVEYVYEYRYNITIDLTLSSNKWETGKEITATATCSCEPINNTEYWPVTGFTFILKGASGEVVAYDPPFPEPESPTIRYGIIENGSEALINWGSKTTQGWGSSATFTATFRLESKETDQPYIEARDSAMWSTSSDFAIIYLR